MSKQNAKARHRARECALQAIYQWQICQQPTEAIEAQFQEDQNMIDVDMEYFGQLLHQVPKNLQEIDDHLEKVLDRPFHALSPIELAILRIAVYEFLYRPDVPYKVVINEALQITKTFGSVDGFKYVNGVLDALAKELRSLEVQVHQTK